jgi:hypothetical protein
MTLLDGDGMMMVIVLFTWRPGPSGFYLIPALGTETPYRVLLGIQYIGEIKL